MLSVYQIHAGTLRNFALQLFQYWKMFFDYFPQMFRSDIIIFPPGLCETSHIFPYIFKSLKIVTIKGGDQTCRYKDEWIILTR
jgi:hypothetical protein